MGCGIGIKRSCSSYDIPKCVDKLPNPDPSKWVINRCWEDGRFLLVDITYPDCTNYEGRKLLLYRGVSIDQLKSQKLIDPHFSENKKYFSPIARFEPTDEGWRIATICMDKLALLELEFGWKD